MTPETEQLAGTGDVIQAGGERIARLPYRARIVHPGRGTLGRVGHTALALELSPEEAAFLALAGHLTFRLEDGREVDFLITTPQRFSGFVQVPTFNRIHQPPSDHAAAFHYVRDDARRRILITMRQLLPTGSLLVMVNRQLTEGTWTYGTRYDLRAVHDAPPRVEAIVAARHVGGLIDAHGPRGPVAIVTRAIEMVAAAQAYASDSALGGNPVEVFLNLDDADYWLAHRMRHAVP
jgi:hypothetical protein